MPIGGTCQNVRSLIVMLLALNREETSTNRECNAGTWEGEIECAGEMKCE
jgi:hypothetical protein